MGADANAVVEVNWGHGQYVPLATFHFYDRDYNVFGELNGVRRSLRVYGPPDAEGWRSKISDAEIEEPLVVEPRGLPRDASQHTFDFAHDEGTTPFRPTWLTRDEVEQVDRQIERLHGEPGGLTWQAILACMKSTHLATRLVFWTDQS